MRPMMINVGATTPACQGSKKTRISCNPRKYQGAFDGLGVRPGFAGSSSGASTSRDQTSKRRRTNSVHKNSLRTRYGQLWTLSSPGPVAFLIDTSTRLPSGFTSAAIYCTLSTLGVMRWGLRRPVQHHQNQRYQNRSHQHSHGRPHRLQRGTGKPVAANSPKVHGHEEARDQRDEDAMEDVEAQQGMRTDLTPAEEKRTGVIHRVYPQKFMEGTFVS